MAKCKLLPETSIEQIANSFAHFIPEGDGWNAKFVKDTNLRKFVEAFSFELKRIYDGMNDLTCDYDINNTAG